MSISLKTGEVDPLSDATMISLPLTVRGAPGVLRVRRGLYAAGALGTRRVSVDVC